jgi:hypothetical protein
MLSNPIAKCRARAELSMGATQLVASSSGLIQDGKEGLPKREAATALRVAGMKPT